MRLTSGCGGVYRTRLSHRTVPHPTPVYARFTEGFGFPDLVEARALLEDLGATPAVPGAAANPAPDR